MSEATQRNDLASVIIEAYGEDAAVECPCEQDLDVAGAILAAGFRRPRTVETADELDALTDGSAIVDSSGDVGQKLSGRWYFPETASMGSSKVAKYGPATVIWEPAV